MTQGLIFSQLILKNSAKFNVATTIVTGFSLHPTLALAFLILYITKNVSRCYIKLRV